MYTIPVYHPIWQCVRVDGSLGEDEEEPDSDNTIEVGGSEGDWWDEMDEAAANRPGDALSDIFKMGTSLMFLQKKSNSPATRVALE
jgi:hypothetical protein